MINPNDIICTKCKQVYPKNVGNFSPQKETKSGYKYICKICCSEEAKKRRALEQGMTGAWMGSSFRKEFLRYKEGTITNEKR